MGTSRRTTAAQDVREGIKRYIFDHRLAPGSPVPSELELCETLGVSRSSVREAVRQLDALDIVHVRHGNGTFVGGLSLAPLVDSVTFRAKLDPRDTGTVLREIVEVRRALDLGYAPAIVTSMEGKTHKSLHRLVETMIKRSARGDGFAAEDRAFHSDLLAHGAANQLMENLTSAFWDIHTELLAHLDVPEPQDITETAEAHGAMLRAAEAGDHEAYRDAVLAHYRPLLRVLERTWATPQPSGTH